VAALDALAAAYAAAGRFDEAIATAQAALDSAAASGLGDVAAQLRERLAVYQKRESYRAPR